jgi:hypothetical protein
MYSGAYLNLVGGRILGWYYYYYTWILQSYFGLNPTAVFKQIQSLTKVSQWNNKKITVKLAISNRKITKINIMAYSNTKMIKNMY